MMTRVRVFVTPKRGILDPQGKAVEHGLHALGFPEVSEVRVGKVIELRLDARDAAAAEARVRAMCTQLLANEVIEDFQVEVRGVEGRRG
jgi:phosphoribosylformylglycinamidine synthase